MVLFSDLMRQFCQRHDLGQPERVINGDWITVAGIPFCFAACPESAAPHAEFQVYADCGPVSLAPVSGGSSRQLADVMAFLLETNLYASSNGGPVFGMSEKDHHVICIQRLSLDGMTPERLSEFLRGFAVFGREWQTDPVPIIKKDNARSNPLKMRNPAQSGLAAALNDPRLRRL